MTLDWFQSYVQISDAFPGGIIYGAGLGVCGDMSAFGRMFCGVQSKGSLYSIYRDIATAT
jgi:hypothetical protein